MNTYAILWPCLQQELLEKEAVHASVLDQLRRLQGRVDQLEGVEAANTAMHLCSIGGRYCGSETCSKRSATK